MTLCCARDERRDAVRRMKNWNGIDYIEVSADQRTLHVYFLGKLPEELATDEPGLERYLAIEGGDRITDIRILDVDPKVAEDPELDDRLEVRLDKSGDFSRYTLRLVGVENVDERYASACFSFKIDCPSDLDCAPPCDCEPPALAQPTLSYLAKDYGSLRQLILDRMALLAPAWRERHAPDLGIALVELLAYEGDYLSYFQDAVATEAYLDTARRRISVRRHVRLIDYLLHEGCNARAFVAVSVGSDMALPSDVSFITGLGGTFARLPSILEWNDLREVSSDAYEVFEPMDRDAKISLYVAHNEIRFHTFGRKECCIDRGATQAALVDGGLHLKPGDVLIFEEVLGPVTGLSADADPTHRHAVRLTRVTKRTDPVVKVKGRATKYVEIEWAEADRLPFPLCISAVGAAPLCASIDNVSVARGNVVLVDHGRSCGPKELGTIPAGPTSAKCVCEGRAEDVAIVSAPVDLRIDETPLTFRTAIDPRAPVAAMFSQDARRALPALRLASTPAARWELRRDLLASRGSDAHAVAEIDDDGVAHVRFGDGELGLRPAAGAVFQAEYRIGNGTRGNVGAESISRLVVGSQSLSGADITVRNPLPAGGGIDPEPIAEAKLCAPQAMRSRIERAITADDYETLAERIPHVQRASAELVWTGSWYEADVAVDPYGSEHTPEALAAAVTTSLETSRRMGHDLHVEQAVYVPLDLELVVCALPGYQRAHVRAALLDVFSSGVGRKGVKGFFHPDNVSFGDDILLSVIVAKAQAVAGVECVQITKCWRLDEGSNKELETGVFPVASHEIVRLDNDPNHPENGRLVITVNGGR